MSIKHSLLVMLEQQQRYGFELREEFERSTGSTWPLNIGQVYTTLDRLERDGLVSDLGTDERGHRYYSITEAGRMEVATWFSTPVAPSTPPRNELAIKLALALGIPRVDVAAVIQTQRLSTIQTMQGYVRSRREADKANKAEDFSWRLVLESLIYSAEAELKWLDHCEAKMLTMAKPPTSGTASAQAAPARTLELS
ncbi:helix-turn-helix transcriptional regulator [Paeniglutamicibacter psychrophenolicus]|uniref:DNA-binding PadR family transcriptional regulator n=1 Tax=Paeniglutamicibacter psychrophenolicus TaxID=257454 RepID=A0ABS4WCB4_9MICC|nr:DNA-binding PadR family transcriptional regulator [Paeniglutamicibacter psychrophenolicus]